MFLFIWRFDMAKKEKGRTRREQYDAFLIPTYKTTCQKCDVVGIEFEKPERQRSFHYALMEQGVDKYLFYDGNGCRAIVVSEKGFGDRIKNLAVSYHGRPFRVYLDEEI